MVTVLFFYVLTVVHEHPVRSGEASSCGTIAGRCASQSHSQCDGQMEADF